MSGADESGDDRRVGERIPINEEFSRDASTWVSDLSRGGVFVHSKELLPVGSLIELRFTIFLDDPTVIEAFAKVVRHSRRPHGMGVEFVSLTAEMTEHIEALLDKHRPIDSGTPVRLPEPQASGSTPAKKLDPHTLEERIGPASYSARVAVDDTATTRTFPRVESDVHEQAKVASVFRPPPAPAKQRPAVSPSEEDRTRQFPTVKRRSTKPK